MRKILALAFLMMASTPAWAQPAAGAAAPAEAGGIAGFLQTPVGQIAPIILMVVLFYFLLIRPQQQRAKQQQEKINSVKRGDTVVMSSGMIGKVVRVEEGELGVEIAQGVTVKVVKGMIADIRAKGVPAAANDPKA